MSEATVAASQGSGVTGRLQLRDAPSVVRRGVATIAAHWPVLLVIYLGGQAVRNAALWAAVVVSNTNSTLGAFLVPFAPLATLSSFILMLRVVAPSLEVVDVDLDTSGGRGDRIRSRLTLLAGTLVPFLAVYALQGYLSEDQFVFINEATYDEFANNVGIWLGTGDIDIDRTAVATGFWYWALVGLALVLRWGMDRFKLPERGTAWGLVAAWVEVSWLTLLATSVANQAEEWRAWLEGRQFVATLLDWWEAGTGLLGPLGEIIRTSVSWLWGAVGSADTVIVVPLAWMTVGAVVYGRDLQHADALPSHDPRVAALQSRVRVVPKEVRAAGQQLAGGTLRRFKNLASGVRTLAAAGLAPMLVFCLVFMLAAQSEYLARMGARWVIGPRDATDMVVFAPWVALFGRAVNTVVMIGLLAAAVDRIVGTTGDQATSGDQAPSGDRPSSGSDDQEPVTAAG